MLAPQLGESPGVAHRLRVGKLALDLLGPGEGVGKTVAEAQLSLPYF